MRQLVQRYGPNGAFWKQNRGLPKVPVREWQIWNEEDARFFWRPSPWAPGYVKLMKATYPAIHGADHGAKVVAGSFVGAPESPWDAARDLYRAGGRRYFDIVSVHPFTNNPNSVQDSAARAMLIAQFVRNVMNHYGDRNKPIILTEMTWTATLHKIPADGYLGFDTTAQGQAARLQAAYRLAASDRSKLNISQVYWFTWASSYQADGITSTEAFNFSGLNLFNGSTIRSLPLLTTYANVAAQLEGCHKTTVATRCR
jgi:hypothetical protein